MTKTKSLKGWFVTIVGALFFFYAFFQCNMMNPLNMHLVNYFKATSYQISLLSSWYFWANVLFIIPAGLILDRFSVKAIMLINMLIAVLGSIIFAYSTNLYAASFARFLEGFMMSFGLIACLKLASVWLDSSKMAFASSLIVTIGMLGAIVAQTPLVKLIDGFGWQKAVLFSAFLGIFIGVILALFVKDPKKEIASAEKTQKVNVFSSLKAVLAKPQNWFCGLYICLLNLPVAILGALFGISYLSQIRGFSQADASSITSMLFFGMIIGSPFFGWFSDNIKSRKIPMWLGSICCLVFVLIAFYLKNIDVKMAFMLFFLIGFTSSAQVLGYPTISESNSLKLNGTAMGFAAFLIMGGGYGLGLPFVGKLLENYSYNQAFLTVPIGIVISFFMIYFMKETKCKSL